VYDIVRTGFLSFLRLTPLSPPRLFFFIKSAPGWIFVSNEEEVSRERSLSIFWLPSRRDGTRLTGDSSFIFF